MRYGVFGDIHGNLHALRAVLKAYEDERIDTYLCTGDLVGYGAYPKECIGIVRDLCAHVVAGNHDFAVCGRLTLEFFNSYAKSAVLWTREALSEKDLAYLRALPLMMQVNDSVTLAHATVYDAHTFDYIQTQYDCIGTVLGSLRTQSGCAFSRSCGRPHQPSLG